MKGTIKSWSQMFYRCNSVTHQQYKDYGGRGITVCERWDRFRYFLEDMGKRPPGKTLDRIDNNKGYYKENCRWATPQEQAQNKRDYSNNKSGLRGVHFCNTQKVWVATCTWRKKRKQLYKGNDFFEACCARKSWELKAQLELGL